GHAAVRGLLAGVHLAGRQRLAVGSDQHPVMLAVVGLANFVPGSAGLIRHGRTLVPLDLDLVAFEQHVVSAIYKPDLDPTAPVDEFTHPHVPVGLQHVPDPKISGDDAHQVTSWAAAASARSWSAWPLPAWDREAVSASWP